MAIQLAKKTGGSVHLLHAIPEAVGKVPFIDSSEEGHPTQISVSEYKLSALLTSQPSLF